MATNPLLSELRAGRLDLVVGTLPIEGGGDLEIYPIYSERLLLVGHPAHPLARRRNLTSAALEGQALISFHEGAITRRIIEAVLEAHGVSVRITMTTDSPEAIRNLVAAGLGLAILPERVVRDGIRRRSIVEIRIPGLAFERTLGLIIPQRRYCSSTVRAFLAVMAKGLAIDLPGRLVLGEERSAAAESRMKTRRRLKKRRIR
jgi:DNA-binding transcriptional LysR family regulator